MKRFRILTSVLMVGLLLVAGGSFTAVASPDGSVYAWGHNLYGQLGDGTVGVWEGVPTPQAVTILAGVDAIAGGWSHSLAVSDGTLYAWGRDYFGQLGDGTIGEPQEVGTPQEVVGLTEVDAVAAGGSHSLAVSDGAVYAWGFNYYGQLGDGTAGNYAGEPSPQQVAGLTDVVQVAAGGDFSLALSGGYVYGWGENYYGQIGQGEGYMPHVPTPQQVINLTDVDQVAAGFLHVLALSQGTVYAWGSNTSGQLGVGKTGDELYEDPTPHPVIGLTDVVQVAAGGYQSLALVSDGTVYAWGYNFDENWDGVPTPQAVTGLTDVDVIQIAAGNTHSLALASDGTVYAWGYDYFGQLGDGTVGDFEGVLTPQQVTALTGVVKVAAGGAHSLALLGVADMTAPTITVTAPRVGASYAQDATATVAFSCADEPGGSGLASCAATVDGEPIASGAALPTTTVGSHRLTVSARDQAGNTAALHRDYTVFGTLSGPVDPQVVNIGKAGAGVPVVFSLPGDYGLGIFTAGTPTSREVLCDTLSGPSDPVETVTANPAGLTYAPATDTYTYTWKTQKNWAGTCRELSLKFGEAGPYSGADVVFAFRFR
jgi:alpha-tubulin suppressor-like RCC1 family protein